MELINNKIFTGNKKAVIYSLLTKVMDADKIRREEEVSFLESIAVALVMTQEDIARSNELSLDECKEELSTFDNEQRATVKRILVGMAYADGKFVKQEEELIEYLKLDISRQELELIAEWRDEEQKIVGFYTCKKDGRFCFEDIRSLRFSELKYKDDGEIIIDVKQISNLTVNKYYEFSWTIELDDSKRGFRIIPKEYKFKEVQAKELVDRLYNNWKSKDYDTIKQMSDVQRMVNTQLTASSDGTFIYELLQNANDYPIVLENRVQLVDVEFHITDHYLIYRHTGRLFSPRNIAAISKMSDGEKKKEKNAIGYKGIGFKTVFSENQYVYLKSGEYSLRFDESITRKGLGSSKFPWQLMPIWTPEKEVDQEVVNAMKNEEDFRVQMAIRPDDSSKLRNGEKSYEFIFNDIFKDEKDILFIPNIKSVKVFYDGVEQIYRIKDPEKWVLTEKPLVYKFTNVEIEENNGEILSNKSIPEKYKDFEDTRVSFACQRDGRKIVPVERARIYCYLPTQVSLGFPFLMNTDMIPTGPRDDFEKKIKFNHKIMKIAGGKLAEWISSLLHSGEYDLCSVFSIVPSFEKIENYEDFIEEFKEGFDSKLDKLELIPCENGEYSVVFDTIIDETGLLTTGIISDEEFTKFSNLKGSLPAKELRQNRKFKSFVKKYIDQSNIFDDEALLEMVRKNEFKEWLKVQDNNNKFLNYLLENKYLEDFLDEEIFIEHECGELYSAKDLYYDIDAELNDLSAFSSHLCYLSSQTREYFKNNEDWDNVICAQFAEFNGENFVNKTLLDENWDETIKALENWDTSFHFYNYIAKNNIVPDELKDLPFFNDEDSVEIVGNFNDKFVFISSESGKETCAASWLSQVSFAFISPKYDQTTLNYLKENADVLEYSDDIIVNDIILSEDFQDEINESQQEDYSTSESFVRFCYEHKSLFDTGSLKDYALNAADCDGDLKFVLFEEHVFFPSTSFDEYSKKEWLNSDWMYCLDSSYLKIDTDTEKVKAFLKKVFYINELDVNLFYRDIVSPNIANIIDNTSGSNDSDGTKNLDFISFLDDNYKLIFEIEKDAEKFSSFVLLGDSDDDSLFDIASDSSYVYAYNDELKEILDSTWFPTDTVNMCTKKYGNSKAITAIKAKNYSFSKFFEDVIAKELKTINDTIDSKESSIAFHTFVSERLGYLVDTQRAKMKGAKVYLYGCDDASASSEGHKILSRSARELCSMGLVEFSDLDIIDPDYHIENNEDYWKKYLNNEHFTVTDFFNWLKDNTSTFYDNIKDKANNIKFWRWVKGCKLVDSTLEKLPVLPIYLSSGGYINSDEIIYLSDDYVEEGGLETIVKKYQPEASFISAEYISDNEDLDVWMNFWVKIGIRFEMVDILINTIDSRLDELEDDKLPDTLAKYRAKLDEHYEGELISKLTNLRIKTRDGIYRKLSSTVYINTNIAEPFPYIAIPNSISFVGKEQNVSALMLQIATEAKATIVNGPLDWRKVKLKRYAELQATKEKVDKSLSDANIIVTEEESDSVVSFDSIHFALLKDLASIKSNKNDSISDLETSISSLKLYSSTGVLTSPKTLTAGSVYKPLCDYQLCDITEEITYITEKYADIENINSLINGTLGVRSGFSEKEIPLLEKYPKFARYFWEIFLAQNIAGFSNAQKTILGYFRDNKFSLVACIPTEKSVVKPEELYYGKEVDEFVDRLPNYREKIPAVADIVFEENGQKVSLFSLLPFKSDKLSLQDCFDALVSYNDQKRRPKLLSWIVSQFNKQDAENIAIRDAYRNNPEAKWISGDNDTKRIDELFALDNPNGKLSFYFGSHPKVFNTNYFPKGEDYLKACDCLAIRVIHDNTADMETVHVKSNTPDMTEDSLKQYLQMAVLILAGIESASDWEQTYNVYSEAIYKMKFICCESIILRYKNDNNISTDSKRFYHQSGTNTFMYVDSYKDPRLFTDFVGELMSYLGAKVDKDIVLNLLYDKKSALAEIEKRNQLKSDERFMQFMDVYESGISSRYKGKKADETPIETKIEHKSIEVKESKEEKAIKENDKNDGAEDNSTSPITEKNKVPDEENIFKENNQQEEKSQTNKDKQINSETPEDRVRKTQTKPSYERFDPNKYKRREMKVGTQNPKTMGINRIINDDEKRQLSEILGRAMETDIIMNENYIVRLRFYNEVVKKYGGAKMDIQDFVTNKHSKLESIGNKFIHRCSARCGTLYISQKIWNLLAQDECVVCMYYGKYADDFIFIESQEELMQMIDQDAIIIQVTGNDKKDIVNKVYNDVLSDNIYTLIRTIKEDNSQLVYTSPNDIPANSYSDEDIDPDMF